MPQLSSTTACVLSLMVLEFTATILKLLHVKNAKKNPVPMFPLRTTGLTYNLFAQILGGKHKVPSQLLDL